METLTSYAKSVLQVAIVCAALWLACYVAGLGWRMGRGELRGAEVRIEGSTTPAPESRPRTARLPTLPAANETA